MSDAHQLVLKGTQFARKKKNCNKSVRWVFGQVRLLWKYNLVVESLGNNERRNIQKENVASLHVVNYLCLIFTPESLRWFGSSGMALMRACLSVRVCTEKWDKYGESVWTSN